MSKINYKQQCIDLGLDMPDSFKAAPEEEIARNYNGAGPDWLPAWGRKILSKFLEIFYPAFVVHDWDYKESDKTLEGFDIANNRMRKNMKIILDKKYPFAYFWLWPLRSKWYTRMEEAYFAVDEFGMSAWKD